MKKRHVMNEFDTDVVVEIDESVGNVRPLIISAFPRTNGMIRSQITFGHVTKKDMLKLSEVFRDLAGILD